MKTKKTYKVPEIKVVFLKSQEQLMQSSGTYYGPAGFNNSELKDYYA